MSEPDPTVTLDEERGEIVIGERHRSNAGLYWTIDIVAEPQMVWGDVLAALRAALASRAAPESAWDELKAKREVAETLGADDIAMHDRGENFVNRFMAQALFFDGDGIDGSWRPTRRLALASLREGRTAPPVAPPEGERLRDLHERTAEAAYRLRVMADEASSRGERGRLHAKAEGVSLALSYITEAAALREAPGLRDDEGTEEGR
jgi:hypothetical protein